MAGGPTLLVDTSFLGDVLCAEPLVRAVTRQHPEGPVDFLTSPGSVEVLANHPGLREVLVFDKRGADRGPRGLVRAARRLRKRDYARALCSHRSWRTAALLRLARIPERVGFHNASAAWLYTRRVGYRPELHEIERNLELVGGGAWERPRMFPSPAEVERAEGLGPPGPFVALAPGSLWGTKRWPAERWGELLARLLRQGWHCLFLGSKADSVLCGEVERLAELSAEEAERVHDRSGATNLRESFALLRHATALVTNDSAPMHLGVAAGIPVIAVYCSTLPEFGFAPRGSQDRVFEVTGLDCRPCGIHGRPECPEGHFRCGWDTEAAAVAGAVAALGDSGPAG